MSNVIFLLAAYVIVVVGLALYVLALWRQQASLAEKLATPTGDDRSLLEEDE